MHHTQREQPHSTKEERKQVCGKVISSIESMSYKKFDILSDLMYSYNYQIERRNNQSFDDSLKICGKRV